MTVVPEWGSVHSLLEFCPERPLNPAYCSKTFGITFPIQFSFPEMINMSMPELFINVSSVGYMHCCVFFTITPGSQLC